MPTPTRFIPSFTRPLLILTFAWLFTLTVLANAAPPETTNEAQPITLLTANDHTISLQINPPPLNQSIDDQGWHTLTIDGYGYQAQLGQPALPYRQTYLALPPGAVPHLTIDNHHTIPLSNLKVAPTTYQQLTSYDFNDPQAVPEFTPTQKQDPIIYNQNKLFPASPASLGPITYLRDYRVVPLILQPVLYNPLAENGRFYQSLTLTIHLTYPNGQPTTTTRPESDTYQTILADEILNYDQAQNWRHIPSNFNLIDPTTNQTSGSPNPNISPCLDNNAFRLNLTQTGMYRLTYTALANAGFPANVNTDTIRVCHRANELAIHVEDNDGTFSTGDALIFYGQAIKTQETETNVYWLTHSGDNGLRMTTDNTTPNSPTTATSYPHPIHLETDERYFSTFPMSDDNDHWYYEPFAFGFSGTPDTLEIDFNVTNRVASGYDLIVEGEIRGFTSSQNHAYEIYLNGNLVGSRQFVGSARYDPPSLFYEAIAANSSLIREGSNTLSIKAVGMPPNNSPHTLIANWFQVTPHRQFVAQNNALAFTQNNGGDWRYTVSGFSAGQPVHIYDVTVYHHPVRLTNGSGTGTVTFDRTASAISNYQLATTTGMLTDITITKDTSPTTLLSQTNQRADYIIITAPELDSALTPLIERRTNQGHTVAKVYVQDIFDEFNYGLYDTNAIRNFLAYTYANWQAPAPSYVLLAGEGSYDHRNVLGLNGTNGNLVPVYLRSGVDSNWGEAASDNQYVTFLGNDELAEMMLGRLPALNTAELTTMVNKILTYESLAPDTWQGRHYFLTDNGLKDVGSDCEMDAAGDFFATANNFIANYLPDGQFLRRTYYAPPDCYPNPPHYYQDSILDTTLDFRQKFREGNQFVIYTGHSAIETWGHEQFVSLDADLSSLNNGNKTPIMLPMTCLEGIYHRPGEDGLAEGLLKSTIGGSVASYSPTGLQVQYGHDFLIVGFYDAIYNQNASTLGQAVMGAKTYLNTNTNNYQDLQDTFMLLGDPAMQLNIWQTNNQTFLPGVVKP
ncbi:MAG TPA: C25 family cysteine peptidase [Anaerolineae bacterium]|nr:C25 family cysteine peptidase [Anaerolineae bacterium]